MLDLTASTADDFQVLEPPSKPDPRRCRRDESTRIDSRVDFRRKFSELRTIDNSTVLERIDHRQAMAGFVPDPDEESPRKVDTERFQSHPFRDRAVDERTWKWESRNSTQDELHIHFVGVQRDRLGSSESKVVEEGLVEMRENPVDRS